MSDAAAQLSAVPGEAGFSAFVFPLLAGPSADGHSLDDDRVSIEQKWRARGHAAGYTEGMRAAAVAAEAQAAGQNAEHQLLLESVRQQHQNAVATLQAAVRALDDRTMPVVREAEDSVLAAGLALAEAIVGHVLTDEAAAVRYALARVNGPGASADEPIGRHTVRLHPLDLAVLSDTELARTDIDFLADATLNRGDAVSEFPHGFLDARIDTALARAKTALGARDS